MLLTLIAPLLLAQPVFGDHLALTNALTGTPLRILLIGDSHAPPENTNGLYSGIQLNWPLPLRLLTLGYTLTYPLTDYTKLPIEPGDDPAFHVPARAQTLTWTTDTPSGATCVSVKRTASTRARFLLYNHPQAPTLTLSPGASLIPPAPIPAFTCTPWADGPEIKLLATSADETGLRLLPIGAQFEFPTGLSALQAAAFPGWNTAHHAALTGSPGARWYDSIPDFELATRPPFPTDGTLPIFVLCHKDGRDWSDPNTPTAYASDLFSTLQRFIEPFNVTRVLYIQLYHSPTTDAQDPIAAERAQWEALRILCAQRSAPPSVCVSIAEATDHALFTQYLKPDLLHVANPQGRDFFSDLLWALLSTPQ